MTPSNARPGEPKTKRLSPVQKDRQARRAAALRANLRKRKAQSRVRRGQENG
ncbi:MAG: hypothetical protein J4G10_03400 [Alphaproteobacteria bacterium]|nr:hypothetical protein [Alphaproteobacteria bacterium]